MKRNEDECFARFRRTGDAAALGSVVDLVGPELLRIALHVTGHPADAEDLVQETLVVALERAGSWNAAQPLRPWLVGILTHRARHLRERARRPLDAERLERSAPRRPDDAAVELELTAEVDAAILDLPAACQPVLVLRLKHHLAVAEIADALRRPPGTVRSQLQRGLERLRERLPASYAGAFAFLIDPPARGLEAVRAAVLAQASAGAAATVAASGPVTSLLGALSMKHVLASAVVLVCAAAGITLLQSERRAPTERPAAPRGGELAVGLREELLAPDRDGRELVAPTEVGAPPSAPSGAPAVASGVARGALLLRVRQESDRSPAGGYLATVEPFGIRDAFSDPLVVRTDERGEALVPDLPAGQASVRVLRGREGGIAIVAGETVELELFAWDGITANVRVVDRFGAPVEGAAIWVSRRFESNIGHLVDTTDSEGRARVASLTSTHYIGAQAPGYAASLLAPISGEPGSVHPVELVLDREGGAVVGSVADARGAPIENALVILGPEQPTRTEHRPDGSFRHGPPLFRVHTDERGAFRATALEAGALDVLVLARGFAPYRTEAAVAPGLEARIDVTLQPEARIVGRVVDAAGAAVVGAQVATLPIGALDGTLTYTDTRGEFVLRGLGSGEFRLEAEHRAAGRATTTMRLRFGGEQAWNPTLDPTPRVFGVVRDATGAPLENWSVVLSRADEPDLRARCVTDASGAFGIGELDALPYRLWVQQPAGWTDFPRLILDEVVAGGPLELVVPEPAETSAAISIEVAHADGRPASEGRLTVWHDERRLWREFALGDAGTLLVESVPPGNVSLELQVEGAPWKSLGDHEVWAGAVLEFGRVTLERGGFVEGALRGAVDDTTELAFLIVGPDGREAGVVTRTGARYRSSALAPGDHRLELRGVGVAPATTSFTIAAGGTVRRDLDVFAAPTRTIAFEVSAGLPTPRSVWCELRTPAGERAWMDGNLAREGERWIARVSVPPGLFRIHAASNNGLVAEAAFTMTAEGDAEAMVLALARAASD